MIVGIQDGVSLKSNNPFVLILYFFGVLSAIIPNVSLRYPIVVLGIFHLDFSDGRLFMIVSVTDCCLLFFILRDL